MNSPQFEIPCVILCGGKSSRMGEDKALLPFSQSKTLTQFQYEKLKPYFKELYISSKTDKFNFSVNLILDKEKEHSPIVALKSIFEYLASYSKVFIITVDTPLVEISTIKKLVENSYKYDITLAKTPLKEHNLCGVFSTNSIKNIDKMLNDGIHKVGYLLKKMDTHFIEFKNEDEFINLNKKAEYNRAKLLIS